MVNDGRLTSRLVQKLTVTKNKPTYYFTDNDTMRVCIWFGCSSDIKPKSMVGTSSVGLRRRVTALFRVNLGQFVMVFCDSNCDVIH